MTWWNEISRSSTTKRIGCATSSTWGNRMESVKKDRRTAAWVAALKRSKSLLATRVKSYELLSASSLSWWRCLYNTIEAVKCNKKMMAAALWIGAGDGGGERGGLYGAQKHLFLSPSPPGSPKLVFKDSLLHSWYWTVSVLLLSLFIPDDYDARRLHTNTAIFIKKKLE